MACAAPVLFFVMMTAQGPMPMPAPPLNAEAKAAVAKVAEECQALCEKTMGPSCLAGMQISLDDGSVQCGCEKVPGA